MKFSEEIRSKKVPEWNKAYLDYEGLKKILTPYKISQKLCVKTRYYKGEETINLVGISVDDPELAKFKGIFESFLVAEINKIDQFFQFKLLNVISTWKNVYESYLSINCKRKKLISDFDKQQKMLKTSFHAFYRQIRLLQSYVDINKEGIKKILKKYKSHTKCLMTSEDDLIEKIYKKKDSGFLARNEQKLETLILEVEAIYLNFFYTRFNRKAGKEELKKIVDFQTNSSNLFAFGIFTGLAIFLILQIIYNVSDQSYENYKLIFPIYRGIGLIILYLWLLGWNVYVWNAFQVNYKLIFKFNHHFSTLSQILTRAAVFTCIFLLSFYVFSLIPPGDSPTQQGLLPLFVWVIFLGYLFFPSDKWLNPEGRKYFYKLLKAILMMPFRKMEFRIGFATDQLVSFIVPLKDLVTALLFYTCDFSDPQQVASRTSSRQQLILTAFVMACLPSIMRIIQCFRAMYDEGKYFKTNNFYNFLKYLSSLITTILSFVLSLVKTYSTYSTTSTSILLSVWILSSIISTCYSYYWDIKKDWGFLTKSKNRFLRDHLVYGNPKIYYTAFVSNAILRLAWVFNISPGFQIFFSTNKDMFLFVIGLMEMFRRCQWNLFRVELEHVKNCDNFKAVDDITVAQKSLDMYISRGPKEHEISEQKIQKLKEEQIFEMHKQALPKNLIDNIKDSFFLNYYLKDNSAEQRRIMKEINGFKNKMNQMHE